MTWPLVSVITRSLPCGGCSTLAVMVMLPPSTTLSGPVSVMRTASASSATTVLVVVLVFSCS
ncbi:hypothetical protein D3C85_1701840 [compost metagenome]